MLILQFAAGGPATIVAAQPGCPLRIRRPRLRGTYPGEIEKRVASDLRLRWVAEPSAGIMPLRAER